MLLRNEVSFEQAQGRALTTFKEKHARMKNENKNH
jgi:hypothetical protein